MRWLQKFLGTAAVSPDQDPEYSQTMHKAEQALSSLPEAEARFIACVAYLMARVGHVDFQISEGEKSRLLGLLKTDLKLPDHLAGVTVEIAIESTLSHANERHLVLNRLNDVATREQKCDVIRLLFHVASDDDISEAESHEIGMVATALHLTRAEFISLRSEFRNHLSILKDKRP